MLFMLADALGRVGCIIGPLCATLVLSPAMSRLRADTKQYQRDEIGWRRQELKEIGSEML